MAISVIFVQVIQIVHPDRRALMVIMTDFTLKPAAALRWIVTMLFVR